MLILCVIVNVDYLSQICVHDLLGIATSIALRKSLPDSQLLNIEDAGAGELLLIRNPRFKAS